MSTLVEEGIGGELGGSGAGIRQAAKRQGPKPIWGVLMVSGSICFGVVMLMSAPTLYVKLVESHTPRPEVASVIPGGQGVDPAAAMRGKALFAQGCNACHGDNARGRAGLGKDLGHNAFVKSLGDPQLVGFLKRGRDVSDPLNTTRIPMPPKGGNPALNDKQLTDLVAYLRDLQGQ
jgi:disulfide bond formation protein DsbB